MATLSTARLARLGPAPAAAPSLASRGLSIPSPVFVMGKRLQTGLSMTRARGVSIAAWWGPWGSGFVGPWQGQGRGVLGWLLALAAAPARPRRWMCSMPCQEGAVCRLSSGVGPATPCPALPWAPLQRRIILTKVEAAKKSVTDLAKSDLEGKVVFVRADLNVRDGAAGGGEGCLEWEGVWCGGAGRWRAGRRARFSEGGARAATTPAGCRSIPRGGDPSIRLL